MLKFKIYILLLYLSILLGIINCDSNSITKPDSYEDFYLRYNIGGGIAGKSEDLEIYRNQDLIYESKSYSIKKSISQEKVYEIFSLLTNNDFFSLDSQYVPEQSVMDDIYFTFDYQSSTVSKTVLISSYHYSRSDGIWKDRVGPIMNYLDKYIKTLTSDVNSGKVTIHSKSILQEWPFSEKINLAENLHWNVFLDEEIYNYLRQINQQEFDVTFFEENYIYRLNGSGGYGLPFSELDNFYISIHDRSQGILWPIEPELSEIGEDGLIVNGSEYKWLKIVFEDYHYPRYFIDNAVSSGEPVYNIRLLHGNHF